MTKPANQTDSFGKFKFELRGVGCRTVVIPDRITLLELHSVVQALFGWYNEHLWEFRDADGRRYAAKRPDYVPLFGVEEKCIPPGKVRLSDVLPAPGAKLFYTYDFGDSWHHVITRQATPKTPGRRCVKTEGPDGIEDIGGVPGLMESKDEWFVPSAEQITERLARVPLKPSRSGPGLLDREKAKQESAIRALNPREWDWFCAFAESGYARLGAPNRRLETLLGLLPGVRLSRLAFLAPEEQGTYQADTPFKRFWRQNRDGWARLRGLPPFLARCSEPRRAERNAIYAFACSAAVLYGAVGKADLLELFEHWRDAADWLRNATPETAVWALESVRRRMYDFGAPAYVRDGLAVSAAKYPPPPLDTPFGPNPALDATLAARKGKERWHPASLKEFLAFQRGAHFLHKEYEDLEAFIRTAWHVDPENRMDALAVHAAVCTAHDAIAAGHGWQKIVSVMLGCLGKKGIEDSVLQRLVHLLLLASNATRMDAHWGFTPDEMFAKYGPGTEADARMAPELPPDAMPMPPAPRPAKIGRNDPCPCGSGKKYKKCCGRPR